MDTILLRPLGPGKSVTTVLWLVLVAVSSAYAQNSAGLLLPYEQRTNVVYAEVHGTGLLMDIFTPKANRNGLGIVDVVSGAYRSDRGKIRDHTMAQVYAILCSHGYKVFAVRPGSISRYTGFEMVDHVRLGIRHVKHHASEYAIDPNRLGITGASAGGHLATLAALLPHEATPDARDPMLRQNSAVQAAAVFFPPTDLLDWDGRPATAEFVGPLLFLGGVQGQSETEIQERARELSPARLVNAPAVPFLVIHGDADRVVPLQQSRKLVEALKAAGGPAELVVKPGGGHPWLTIPQEVKLMAEWFDRQLVPTEEK
ncbi:MAG: prolyl oligopeptidase family serine peptidase [Verrucomicrobia bacterium]|nr:prolyl oligopeptidase family serine peptidase [Verrucomicrobiota bacterium]